MNGMSSYRRRLMAGAYPKELPNYLCFTALEDGEFTYRISLNTGLSLFSYIEYSIDEGTTWVRADNVDGEAVSISTPTIPAGGKVYWRGEGESCSTRFGSDLYSYFSSTGKFNVSGNVFSLLIKKFDENSTRGQFNVFNSLFQNCKVVDASELILGNVSGGFNTYQAFFKNCIYLTGAPALQSDNLRPSQFNEMFRGCTSLTTAPELLSTTLSQSCYQRMFYGCTSLVNVQSTLPALAMTNGCYLSMFEGCTSLINIPNIQATTLADSCFYDMFRNCTSVTTTIDFDKWATLYNSCFRGMYDGCRGLTTIKSLPSNINLPTGCFMETFRDCSSLVSAPDWYIGSFGGEAISGMFQRCTSLVHCPIKSLPATLVGRCCLWLFTGCTSLLDVCDLPAEILPGDCYNSMLQNTKITYIKMLATDISASRCLQNWVSGVPSSGIFVKHIDAQWTTTGNSGVPTNWTIIYYDPELDKYYLDQQRQTECDDHGNPI